MKLSQKLPLCFAAIAIAVAGAGLFGLSELNHSITTYRGAVTNYSEAQEVETTLSTFKTQVQEWKNTLLRGKNDDDRAKYWAAFLASEQQVSKQAVALSTKIAPGEARNLLEQFAVAHGQMGKITARDMRHSPRRRTTRLLAMWQSRARTAVLPNC